LSHNQLLPVWGVISLASILPMTTKRLRLLIFQEAPGMWLVRGLEHDLGAEATTIGEAVRAAVRFMEAHTAFDLRHDHPPLAAFPPAPQKYWNAFATGTAVPLAQLGVTTPPGWDIHTAFATRLPTEERRRQVRGQAEARRYV
jgi:hypothetical protein